MNIARDHHNRIIYRFIELQRQSTRFICMFTLMGSPYQSDSMRHARDVCEGICNRMMLHFLYYCKYWFWFLVMTGQVLLMSPKGQNVSREGLVKLWEGGFYYLQYYYFVK